MAFWRTNQPARTFLDRCRWLIARLLVSLLMVLPGQTVHSEPLRLGFSEPIIDAGDPRTVLVRYQGPIDHPMAENLEEIGKQIGGQHAALILDLDSQAGLSRTRHWWSKS